MIYIICQHRSGSTWLHNIINSDKNVFSINEEINFREPYYIRNDFFKTNRYVKKIEINKLHGSLWKYPEKYNINPSELEAFSNKFRRLKPGKFIEKLYKNFGGGKKLFLIKYPLHPRYHKDLRNSGKFVILNRDFRAVFLSKINDPSSRRIYKKSKFMFSFYRKFIFINFLLDNIFLKSLKIDNSIVINYSDLKNNLSNEISRLNKFLELDIDYDNCKNISGKRSSIEKDNIVKDLDIIEKITLKLYRI